MKIKRSYICAYSRERERLIGGPLCTDLFYVTRFLWLRMVSSYVGSFKMSDTVTKGQREKSANTVTKGKEDLEQKGGTHHFSEEEFLDSKR